MGSIFLTLFLFLSYKMMVNFLLVRYHVLGYWKTQPLGLGFFLTFAELSFRFHLWRYLAKISWNVINVEDNFIWILFIWLSRLTDLGKIHICFKTYMFQDIYVSRVLFPMLKLCRTTNHGPFTALPQPGLLKLAFIILCLETV